MLLREISLTNTSFADPDLLKYDSDSQTLLLGDYSDKKQYEYLPYL